MAIRNLEEGFINIPSNTHPITLNFTGPAIISVNGYYSINNNTVFLYIPAFSAPANMSSGILNFLQLPAILTPQHSVVLIGSVITPTSTETQGQIMITSFNTMNISANVAGGMFASGSICGTYSGQTLIYNLN